ncbi:MAG: hypothetical protein A3G20_06825 [Acidobacteria bacterium RIFCSPLOWO2_12_FULL_59_11]|nr:MAG: hypothetical protein A3G20_06825 [Acidobacteria bacterium RIFCSPLOWO2_12_FULL_59_11]
MKSLAASFGKGQVAANFLCQLIGNFIVARDGFDVPRFGIAPQGMFSAFSFEKATVFPKVP